MTCLVSPLTLDSYFSWFAAPVTAEIELPPIETGDQVEELTAQLEADEFTSG